MSKNYIFKHRLIIFIVVFFCGIGFGIWSMLIPPNGVIDSSVLILIAQIFVLASGVYGMEVHFDIKEGQFHAGQKEEDEKEKNNPQME